MIDLDRKSKAKPAAPWKHRGRLVAARALAMAAMPLALIAAGCGGGNSSAGSSNGVFTISPGTASIDTNCTGCNSTNSSGAAAEQFSATLSAGGAASVTWKVSGGDANTGAGTINSTSGQYTPPSYLTADSVKVTVTAALVSDPSATASATITVTPGFLQPLTPENAALGANGTLTFTGYLAEAGGTTGINYALSNASTGSSGGQGSLGATNCTRSTKTFTYCTVTYTAPSSISATASTFVVATAGSSSSRVSSQILLNTAGVSSNPATHENKLSTPISLGTSGGNNNDYDTSGGNIVDCCGGTLGSLIQNASGTQYLLSNNHVLARSDQASIGETIVQPGLIDANCSPYGQIGSATTPIATLTAFLPLKSSTTNADAAIAAVNSGAVNPSGNILELGALQSNGMLAAAPPGISSTGGKGESSTVGMKVAKSGRTTGLTCAAVSAVNLSVSVDYYTDCGETKPYLTKTYSNQIGVEGNQFSDAGDSGSLVVDTGNAEPVGLFFAGGTDSTTGVGEGIASPAPDVLSELNTQVGGGPYTFVGTTDHAVTCLNYGNSTATAAQSVQLAGSQLSRAQQALSTARMLVNPSAGILGVATGKSSDRAGEGAVIVYVDQNSTAGAPSTIDGVRTVVVPTTARAVAMGSAPRTALESSVLPALASSTLAQAVSVKHQLVASLMRNPAYFGVGVGQSLDNPKEAALVIYVDRRKVPAQLPTTIGGLRTHYIIMDRLHVTRSYLKQAPMHSRCVPHPAPASFDPLGTRAARSLLFR